MMAQGLYLYCLREKNEGSAAISTAGIDGTGHVFVVPYRAWEAVVSEVSLAEFGSQEMREKAREDLPWIKAKSVVHERVIEEAMTQDGAVVSVIPMRFGTIFEDQGQIEAALRDDYPRIQAVFDRIRHKQEWGVKVYLTDHATWERALQENSPALREREAAIASLPEGIAFFLEEERKRTIAQEADRALQVLVGNLFDRLADQAVASVRNKLLAKELTGKRAPMVLNSAHLIRADRVESFRQTLAELTRQHHAQGFTVDHSGPWPAFNFTSYGNEG